MKPWFLGAALAGALVARVANGQGETARGAEDDGCEPFSTVEFSSGSARLDLSAESDLSWAANWTWEDPGRYIVVAAPTGPFPADEQMGHVRAIEAARYLFNHGVHPWLVSLGTYDEHLTASESGAIGRGDSIVILRCVPAPPRLLP